MFANWSIDECSFTVVGHEYYGLPSCGGQIASINILLAVMGHHLRREVV